MPKGAAIPEGNTTVGHAPEVQFFHVVKGWYYIVTHPRYDSDTFETFEEAQADYIAQGFSDGHNQPKETADE